MNDPGSVPALDPGTDSAEISASNGLDNAAATTSPRDHCGVHTSVAETMRSQVQRHLRDEIERASRLRYPLGLLVLLVVEPAGLTEIENDGFRPSIVESIFSHLSTGIRSIDTLGQLDPTRLAVILPGTTTGDLRAIGERLQIQTDFAAFLNHSIPTDCSLSVGGAVFPSHAYDEREMLLVAESACSRSRKARLSHVVIGRAQQEEQC